LQEHPHFAGGASYSSMTPAMLAATLVVAVSVLILPKKYALAPILVITFLTPFAEQIYAGGLHFYVFRIIVLAGGLRMLQAKLSTRGSMFEGGLNRLDKLFCLWAFLHALVFILLYREAAAVTNQMAFLLDSCGAYFLARYLIQDKEDIVRVGKTLVVVSSVLAACMGYEYLTRINVFSVLSGNGPIVPWLREGRVRAQGTFANSTTAGTFGATLVPLFFWLWKSGKAKMGAAIGLLAATAVALTSVSGTGIMAYIEGILALCLWPIRKQMRSVRWGLVVFLLATALVMKAPLWFLLAHITLVGGAHGWDRAMVIDRCMRHIPDWWLLGSKDFATWGTAAWDACDQFVADAYSGGLTTLVLLIMILSRGFGMIGRARRAVEGDRREEWFFWCLGALLFSHVMCFLGIDYFDQTQIWWFICLAIIQAATAAFAGAVTQPAEKAEAEFAQLASAFAFGPTSDRSGGGFGC
jgi:hypothetical protein